MGGSQVDIASTVFLAYTDITAAASRALFGLEGDKVFHILDLPTLEGAMSSCIKNPSQSQSSCMGGVGSDLPLAPVQLINCSMDQSGKPKYTFLIINTHMVAEKSHYVARSIVEMCAQKGVTKLIVLTSQRLDIPESKSKLFENIFNGIVPATQRPSLPSDTVITDAFLSNLIQLCTVEQQPMSCLIAPAHRIGAGQANTEDGSLQLIRLFQNTITDFCGLMFSDKYSASLIYQGPNEDISSSLMYA